MDQQEEVYSKPFEYTLSLVGVNGKCIFYSGYGTVK